jgi:hypothetical protein
MKEILIVLCAVLAVMFYSMARARKNLQPPTKARLESVGIQTADFDAKARLFSRISGVFAALAVGLSVYAVMTSH